MLIYLARQSVEHRCSGQRILSSDLAKVRYSSCNARLCKPTINAIPIVRVALFFVHRLASRVAGTRGTRARPTRAACHCHVPACSQREAEARDRELVSRACERTENGDWCVKKRRAKAETQYDARASRAREPCDGTKVTANRTCMYKHVVLQTRRELTEDHRAPCPASVQMSRNVHITLLE